MGDVTAPARTAAAIAILGNGILSMTHQIG
jgi:hypothetical protein